MRGQIVEADQGPKQVYTCHVCPVEDSELMIEGVYGPGELPMKTIQCQIVSVSPMRGHVYKVILQQPAGKPVKYYPGQYLAIELPGWDYESYYSIACAPEGRELELHIQADPHLEKAQEVIDFLKSNQSIGIKLPMGEACLHDIPEQEVLLLAAGTGFAQMKSIIEHLLANEFSHPLRLYWTARKAEDLYALDMLDAWQKRYPNFLYRTIFADIDHLATDHHSLMADAVLEDHETLSDMLVFVSGSPKLVFSTMDALEAAGLEESQFRSDVLAYAKREDYK